jgi:tRNA(Ile)-lysidine synthase
VFDHGTGAAARAAAEHVSQQVRVRSVPLRATRAEGLPPQEAAWRDARWTFLRRVGTEFDAVIATGHTLDDHLETVLMRALRDAGARGLAALHAGDGVLRPLLDFRRTELAAYASACNVTWVEDPSNASLHHLRNRVRHQLLPALERVNPGIARSLRGIGRRAWALRQDVDAFIQRGVPHELSEDAEGGGRTLGVARSVLADYDLTALRLLWPALAARVGLVLDRRGTERIAEFTITGRPGARAQLAGPFEIARRGDRLVLRPELDVRPLIRARRLRESLALGGWRFLKQRTAGSPADLWWALLPEKGQVMVRGWRPGDRMIPHGADAARRLKGLFRDAGVDAVRRRGWPIVLVDEQIVWIPGVRRSSAATVRSGRPLALYHCERDDS